MNSAMTTMPAPLFAMSGASATPNAGPLVENPAGVLAVLLAVLAVIFWMTQHPTLGKIFKVVPALLFCYFVPTTLTTLNVIPTDSALYDFVKGYVLPASLLLLILALDVPGILRLGPKAVIMLLAGTTGIVLGGPLSLWICKDMLPPDAWQGMTALCGSWIGGGANFVALGKIADASDQMIATMVIPDVFVANCWMAVLLYFSLIQRRIDKWTRADASTIRDLERRLDDFQQRVARIPSLPDLMIILAFGFAISWACFFVANQIDGKVERKLTIETVRLAAVGEASPDAFASIHKERAGEETHTYLTLEKVVVSSGSPADHEAEDEATDESTALSAKSTTSTEAKLMLASPELRTLGDLVQRINSDIAGWEARWTDNGSQYADLPTNQLRNVPRSAVSDAGISLHVPNPDSPGWWRFRESFGATTWKFILITTIGVVLSFTPARRLDGAGASKIGSVMIYLLVACIGAHADFTTIGEQPAYILMGFIWIAVHIVILLGVGLLIRAPIFFVAVGSQANIGGAASAPVVAAAFHPSLAPVGALLAVAGYVLGTYAGLICMWMLQAVAGSGG